MDILYRVPNPAAASLWLSRFFEEPLSCIEGPVHQCRLRVGEHEVRFERPDPSMGLLDRQVCFWKVDDLLSRLRHAHALGAELQRGPLRREDGQYVATIAARDLGSVGLVGPLTPPPIEAEPLPLRAESLYPSRLRRVIRFSGALDSRVEVVGRTGGMGYSEAFSASVDGAELWAGQMPPGVLTCLPFQLEAEDGPVYVSVELRLERNWMGLFQIMECRVRYGAAVLFEEVLGEGHVDQNTLPIPIEPFSASALDLPRPVPEGEDDAAQDW